MREGLKTSLLSIVCVVVASTSAFAAASVRNVGGAGTYSSAASAASSTQTTTARAGSLRSTGTYVRPTTKTATSTKKSGDSSSPATTSATSRSASVPRLSIGKYLGAAKSISSEGSRGGDSGISEERIEALERSVQQLETEKQIVLKDTDYITIQNDEIILDVEKLRTDLNYKMVLMDVRLKWMLIMTLG